jgi:hypothetical protein
MAQKLVRIGAVLGALAFAAPVAAQSVDEDVRCLLAANFFTRAEKDPAKRNLAMAASVFYLGRLDARISNDQLKTAVQVQAKTMSAANLGSIMDNCAKHLNEKGLAMRALGGGPNAPAQAPPASKKK